MRKRFVNKFVTALVSATMCVNTLSPVYAANAATPVTTITDEDLSEDTVDVSEPDTLPETDSSEETQNANDQTVSDQEPSQSSDETASESTSQDPSEESTMLDTTDYDLDEDDIALIDDSMLEEIDLLDAGETTATRKDSKVPDPHGSADNPDDVIHISREVQETASEDTFHITTEAYSTKDTITVERPTDYFVFIDTTTQSFGQTLSDGTTAHDAVLESVQTFLRGLADENSLKAVADQDKVAMYNYGTKKVTLRPVNHYTLKEGNSTTPGFGTVFGNTTFKVSTTTAVPNMNTIMTAAATAVSGDKDTTHNKAVIVFTGRPSGTATGAYMSTLNSAIASSKKAKDAGASVYVIGLGDMSNATAPEDLPDYTAIASEANTTYYYSDSFGTATAKNKLTDDDMKNLFDRNLHLISSNYPAATDMHTPGDPIDPTTDYAGGYYRSAHSKADIADIFSKIKKSAPLIDIKLDATQTIQEYPSNIFSVLKTNVSISTMDAKVSGSDISFENKTADTTTKFTVATNTVDAPTTSTFATITGFDFGANAVGTDENGSKGKKLIVDYDIKLLNPTKVKNFKTWPVFKPECGYYLSAKYPSAYVALPVPYLTENVDDQGGKSTVTVDKTLKDNGTRKWTITLDQYVEGQANDTTAKDEEPADIVFLLDCSGSMKRSIGNGDSTKRVEARNLAMTQFMNQIASMNDTLPADKRSRVSVTLFNTYNSTFKGWTTVTSANAAAMIPALNAGPDSQGLYWFTDPGAAMADQVTPLINSSIKSRPNAHRYVIFLTDGEPCSESNHTIDMSWTKKAVRASSVLKDLGAEIFSVNITNIGETLPPEVLPDFEHYYKSSSEEVTRYNYPAADESNLNPLRLELSAKDSVSFIERFMQLTSSNYPDAYNNRANAQSINPQVSTYCYAAHDTQTLLQVFSDIYSQISPISSKLNVDSQIRDMITDEFKLADADSIKTYTMDAQFDENGNLSWTNKTPIEGLTITSADDHVYVTGFDYLANAVLKEGHPDNTSFYGRKLLVDFDITTKSNKTVGENIPTNKDTSGIYADDNTEDAIIKYPIPSVTLENASLELDKKAESNNDGTYKITLDQYIKGDTDTGIDAATQLRDYMTDEFELAADPNIKTYTMDAQFDENGNLSWTNKQEISGLTIDSGSDHVFVSGYDYVKNAVVPGGHTDDTTFYGRKLIVEFNIQPTDATFGGNTVPTNKNTSGIYKSATDDSMYKAYPLPNVDLPIKYEIAAKDKEVFAPNTVDLSTLLDYKKGYTPDGNNNAYVDITYSLKDSTGKVVGTLTIPAGLNTMESKWKWTGSSSTDVSGKYTLSCEVTPVNEGTATKLTKEAPAAVRVYYPSLTLKDSTIVYGNEYDSVIGTVTDLSKVQNHISNVTWSDQNGTYTGTDAPKVAVSLDDPEGVDVENGKNIVRSVNDIPVAVKVLAYTDSVDNAVDVTKNTTFTTDGNGEKNEFVVHVTKRTLTITSGSGEKEYKNNSPITYKDASEWKTSGTDDSYNVLVNTSPKEAASASATPDVYVTDNSSNNVSDTTIDNAFTVDGIYLTVMNADNKLELKNVTEGYDITPIFGKLTLKKPYQPFGNTQLEQAKSIVDEQGNDVSNKIVKVGTKLIYNIKLTNEDKVRDGIAVLTDKIPEGVEYISSNNNGKFDNGTVTWDVSIKPGQTETYSITVKVKEDFTKDAFDNIATVLTDGDPTPVPTNKVTTYVGKDPVKSVEHDGKDAADKILSVGDKVTFKIAVQNPAKEAKTFTITDKIPANMTFVSADNDGINTDGTVTWSVEINAQETKTVSFIVTMDKAGTFKNTANAVVDDATFTSNSVKVNAVDDPAKAVKLGDKNVDGKFVSKDDVLTYTISFTNATDSKVKAVYTDKLPQGVEFVSADNNGTNNNGTITWNAELAAGETKVVSVKVKVVADNTIIANKATVNVPGTDYTKDTNEVETVVLSDPVKSVEHDGKDAADKILSVGDKVTFKIAVQNPAKEAKTFTITDKIPANMTFVSADNDGVNTDGTVTWSVEIKAQETKTVSFIVTMDKAGTFKNTANAAVDDATFTSNSVKVNAVDDPAKAVKLGDKNVDGKFVSKDDVLTYTISFTNATDSKVKAVYTDKLPQGVEFISADNNGTNNNGTVTWNAELASGETKVVSVKVKVVADNTIIVNKATVNIPGTDYTKDTNEVETVVPSDPVKAVLDTEGKDINDVFVSPGNELTYKISFTNPAKEAKTAVVTDKLPAGVTYVSSDNEGTEKDGIVTWNTSFNANETKTFTVKVRINDDTKNKDLVNTADVTIDDVKYTSNDVHNPVPEDPTKVVTDADGKSIDGSLVAIGDELHYAITFNNPSTKDVDAVITDKLPEAVTYVSSDNNGVHENGIVTWKTVVKAGEKIVVNVTVKVNENVKNVSIENKANVTLTGTPYNTDTNIVTNYVPEDPTKVAENNKGVDMNDNIAGVGSELIFKVTFTNPAAQEKEVIFTDELPAGVDFVSADNDGKLIGNIVTWKAVVKAGETKTVSVTTKVNSKASDSSIKNTANVLVDGKSYTTNTTETFIPAEPVKEAADEKGNKIDNTLVASGSIIDYKISFKNPLDKAIKAVYTDVLPDEVEFVSADNDGKLTDKTVTWTVDLAANETKTVVVRVKVKTDVKGKSIVNKAVVAINDISYTAETNEVVTYVPEDPTKTVKDSKGNDINDKFISAGETIVYSITFKNPSKDDIKATITDKLPDEIEFVSADNNGKLTDKTVTWNVDIKAEKSITVSVTAKVKKDAINKSLENTAHVTVDGITYTANTNNVVSYVPQDPVKSVTSNGTDVNGKIVKVGDTLTYKIEFKNPSDKAVDVVITDKLPAGLKFVSADNDGKESNGTITWKANIKAGETKAVSFTVTVTKDAAGKDLKNIASVTVDGTIYKASTNSVVTSVFKTPVKAVKSGSTDINGKTVKDGETVTYTITVQNPATEAKDITVKDEVPSGLQIVSADNNGQISGNTITWTLTGVGAKAEKTVSFTAKAVAGTSAITVKNTATMTLDGTTLDTNTVTINIPAKVTPQAETKVQPEETKTQTPVQTTQAVTVQSKNTGDASNVGMYAAILAAAGLAGAAVLFKKRKKQ